ncbi:ABC transporter permease [Rhizobium sp. TRM95796]|uniref:ABC transporter permease n=1 Tax=Rhizobium sp. TRM95796 TaxID=2979862 RepID=UPI0021E96D8C|nr:ABC transporter permease [Rhizobium sp. TRM95796]MCV3768870.1 ABC transporter permease [Rhizobium sp. TRM95796]
MALVYCIFATRIPSYYSAPGVAALLDGAVLAGIIAIGVGLTMIAGEMDLSVGSMAAFAGILSIKFFAFGVTPAFIMVIVICAAIGAVQGYCIYKLNINSMVFTIGTLIALRGLTLVMSDEKTALVPFENIAETDFLSAKYLIFSVPSFVLLALFLIIDLFARRTLFGREIFAIGGGRSEARAAGVSMRRPMVLIFAMSAALAGLAGSLISIKNGSASPLGFEAVLLEAVTACLIGGIALSGGRGSILGILIGLFTIRFLVSGIAALGAPFWMQSLATGALMIFVIISEALIRYVLWRRRFAYSARLPA